MKAPAYSLWDAIYYTDSSPRRRAALGSAVWRRGAWGRAVVRLVSEKAWRRSLRRRPMTTLFGLVVLLSFAVLLATLAMAVAVPDLLRSWISPLGIKSPAKAVGGAMMVFALLGVVAAMQGAVRPWVVVGWNLRPARRWRLWGYQAGAAGRGPPDFLDVLAREQAVRVEFWRARLQKAPGWRAEFVYFSVDALMQQLTIVGPLALAIFYWLPALFGVDPAATIKGLGLGCAFPIVVWTPIFMGVARHRFARRRLLRTLEHSRCPDCGYDLFAVPPTLPKDKVPGAGPSRCPECGSMWPLVPPPVDIDEA